jgi:hypothetical protein
MANLQQLLTTLGNDQKLGAGYLTPVGTPAPTALQTVIALKQQLDPFTLLQNPLTPPISLFTPAYVYNGAGMPAGIYLDDVSGNVDASHGAKQPAYTFVS